jgi:Tol biopolymer transport system component
MSPFRKTSHGKTRDTAQPSSRGLATVVASLLIGCSSLSAGQIALVRQNSVPEALIPSTSRLLFNGVVTDAGVSVQLFRLQGEGVEWSPDGQWVVYDCKHTDGYYNIHVCRPDGTEDRCLTTLDNGLPHRHAGSPAWHPSGKYIAFAAEKKVHQGGSIEAIPGFGGRSDIWVMSSDGSKAWQLTNTADDRGSGVIIPKFSHDGKKLAWTERVKPPQLFTPRALFGDWSIKVADFIDTPAGPRLANIRTFEPGGTAFYEAYGFSPDDNKIIFDSDYDSRGAFKSQIYVMDAATGGNVRRLTNGYDYNEHASYSPDGRHIVWMTSRDNINHGTDWWIMNADGSDPRRLTHFNQRNYPESAGGIWAVYACLTHWAPNGMQLLGGVQYSLIKQEGRIVLLTLDPSVLSK